LSSSVYCESLILPGKYLLPTNIVKGGKEKSVGITQFVVGRGEQGSGGELVYSATFYYFALIGA
jgi:hypothetical protein